MTKPMPAALRQLLDRFLQRRLLRLAAGGWNLRRLLENQGGRPALAKGGGPSSDGVRIPSQGLRRTRSRPSLGQEPDGVPSFTLPGRRSQNKPSVQIPAIHSPWPISPWPWFRTLYSGDRGSPSQACNLWISASADCLASVSSWRLTSSHSTNLRSPLQARLALLGVPQPLPGGRVIHSHSSPGSPHGGPDRAPRYGPATRRKRTRPRSIGRVLSHPPAARPRPGVKRRPAESNRQYPDTPSPP